MLLPVASIVGQRNCSDQRLVHWGKETYSIGVFVVGYLALDGIVVVPVGIGIGGVQTDGLVHELDCIEFAK